MKSSLLLVCGLILPVITCCGSSSAAENVGTGTAAIEPGDTIQDCSSEAFDGQAAAGPDRSPQVRRINGRQRSRLLRAPGERPRPPERFDNFGEQGGACHRRAQRTLSTGAARAKVLAEIADGDDTCKGPISGSQAPHRLERPHHFDFDN
jgi:hypothetical protein